MVVGRRVKARWPRSRGAGGLRERAGRLVAPRRRSRRAKFFCAWQREGSDRSRRMAHHGDSARDRGGAVPLTLLCSSAFRSCGAAMSRHTLSTASSETGTCMDAVRVSLGEVMRAVNDATEAYSERGACFYVAYVVLWERVFARGYRASLVQSLRTGEGASGGGEKAAHRNSESEVVCCRLQELVRRPVNAC